MISLPAEFKEEAERCNACPIPSLLIANLFNLLLSRIDRY
nr:MAG TPA: hypothetical protein [Caudoviricetes sp.]